MKKFCLFLALFLIAGTAVAAPQTVKLSVPTMDCPVCPITIKKALLQVAEEKRWSRLTTHGPMSMP